MHPLLKIGNKQLAICLLLIAHCLLIKLFSSLEDGNRYVVAE